MKAYIHAFQGRPWNEECAAAYRGFNKLGIECILFTTNEELDQRSPGDIVVGGMLIMGHVLHQAAVTLPNYNYPDELRRYLGRKIWTIQLKDIQHQEFPLFIKPVEEKAAKGIVAHSCDDLDEYDYLGPCAELLCSDVVEFVSEWRCFVYYNKVLGLQFYYGDKETEPDKDTIETAVDEFTSAPAACSLDFGVTADGRTLLIEMNDGIALGCYGLQDELYAMFLLARWAELTGTMDVLRVRTGYVEKAIRQMKDDYLAAYMMIDVGRESGHEMLSDELAKALKNSTKYQALKHYLDEISNEEVWLTDDIYSIEDETDCILMLEAVKGKNIHIHYRTAADRIDKVEQLLEKATEEITKENQLLLDWEKEDEQYILHILKRVLPEYEYTLRLYQDGNGVIIYVSKYETKIRYFKIREPLRKSIVSRVSEKVDYIVSHPEEAHEDDRYFGFPVHCRYGLKWKYSNARDMLDNYTLYEDCDYGVDEYEPEIACMLLEAPEVSGIWMKLHK